MNSVSTFQISLFIPMFFLITAINKHCFDFLDLISVFELRDRHLLKAIIVFSERFLFMIGNF